MFSEEMDNPNIDHQPVDQHGESQSVPIGIERIRREWKEVGLKEARPLPQATEPEHIEQVLFPEVDGGAGIGDYSFEYDLVANQLALSPDAMDRLVATGELDSILVQGPDGETRRMFSESSVKRFQEDSAIDPEAVKRAAKTMADQTLVESIRDLRQEIEDIKGTQGKVLQQMKDMLLLEIRNLKEQDRDLTSFVFELSEEIKGLLQKKRR